VEARAGNCLLEREPEETGCIEPVHGGPAVRAVADVGGDSVLAGALDDEGDEAVVPPTMDGGGEPDEAGADAAGRGAEDERFRGGARMDVALGGE